MKIIIIAILTAIVSSSDWAMYSFDWPIVNATEAYQIQKLKLAALEALSNPIEVKPRVLTSWQCDKLNI